jgi:hypothetical protein
MSGEAAIHEQHRISSLLVKSLTNDGAYIQKFLGSPTCRIGHRMSQKLRALNERR